ncbi:M48 family metallopeptidase [Thalassovita sp.]|uniref:M48 family metallopeptidase n=1 Tax=Thalassovita sp. TaxID=1979401 RepID=UPI0029DE9039|nr:M48 family metallopeptidase [Thalassovita sp.]
MKRFMVLAAMLLAGCMQATPSARAPQPGPRADFDARVAAERFVAVVNSVEPVAEAECRRRAPRVNCDYQIVVDNRVDQPPNAFQTVDRNGRPLIAFTIALIADVENADELALVMGHEAAHHIAGHLDRQRQDASAGAIIFAGVAAIMGGSARDVQNMGDLGASVGARTYSKDYEIEADKLGAVIARRAGYDPVHGAAYFTRMPDPGNRFLGTHPPNARRIEVIRAATQG